MDEGRQGRRGDSEDEVAPTAPRAPHRAGALVREILRPLHASSERAGSARDHADRPSEGETEGGREFGGVERSEAPARSGADVEDAAPAAPRARRLARQLRDSLRVRPGDGDGGGVGGENPRRDPLGGEEVDPRRGGVAPLGREAFPPISPCFFTIHLTGHTIPIAVRQSRARIRGILALLLLASAARAESEPEIRVLLAVASESLALSAEGGFHVDGDGPSRFYPGPAALRARSETAGISLAVDGFSSPAANGVFWAVRPMHGVLRLDGVPYRGRVILLPMRGGIGVVNVVPLESYLRGVVAKEIGPVAPETYEALRAQAIAARTYAMRNLGKNDIAGFDLHGDVRDQAYGGVAFETTLADRAVEATAGLALAEEDGRPAVLYYHSTCGGTTVAAGDLWSNAERPHLRSLRDVLFAGTDSETDACAWSRWYRWRRDLDGPAVRRIFRTAGLPGVPARFEILARSPTSGRIRILVLETADGAETRIAGDLPIRKLLGETALLPSTHFDMERGGGSVILSGRGAGHGAGMCQAGAIGRSRAGETAEEILGFYFAGAELRKMYESEPVSAPVPDESVPDEPDPEPSPMRIRRARPEEVP